jgi:hypothetical protein
MMVNIYSIFQSDISSSVKVLDWVQKNADTNANANAEAEVNRIAPLYFEK